MRKQIFTLFVALVATVAVQAQIISVVSPSGATSLYRTLPEAIRGAQNGSVVYLPGGGFTIADSVKITKKLTIIGVGHRANGDNVDGITTISGKLYFNQGSDGSAVMGCYLSGNIIIAEDGPVNDVAVKYCNIASVQVKNSNVTGIFINQNYVRGLSDFCYSSNVTIKNNVIHTFSNIIGGTIMYNIVWGSHSLGYGSAGLKSVSNSLISGNIFSSSVRWASSSGSTYDGAPGSTGINNLGAGNNFADDDPIIIEGGTSTIFVDVANNQTGWLSPQSNFHFKDEFKQYENKCGIYAGEGFDDSQLAPVPHIIHKDIDDKTDASGKLRVRIRVKASE